MKEIINKQINNCHICMTKIERNPIKIPYEKTDTPHKPREHYHADIWFLSKQKKYLTCIDKFLKKIAVKQIKSKNHDDAINAFEEIFDNLGTPKLITLDNENAFVSAVLQNYLAKENISIHHCTANRHTGNTDIERLHSTLNEHLRVLEQVKNENQEIIPTDHVPRAVRVYNNTIHLTTRQKPIDAHSDSSIWETVFKCIEEKKEKVIGKLNKDRKDTEIDERYIKATEPDRIKNKLVSKHRKAKVIEKKGKKYTLEEGNKFKKISNRILHKDQFAKKKKFTSNISVHRSDLEQENTSSGNSDMATQGSNPVDTDSNSNL